MGLFSDLTDLVGDAVGTVAGIAIAPPAMFERELEAGQLAQPFDIAVDTGGYWLTWLKARAPSDAMAAFSAWVMS